MPTTTKSAPAVSLLDAIIDGDSNAVREVLRDAAARGDPLARAVLADGSVEGEAATLLAIMQPPK